MERRICSIVLLGFLYLVSTVLGCSKLEPGARAIETGHEFETDDRKVYYSKVVVFGEVVRTVQGDYPFKRKDGVHTVEFNVLCTYKGGPVPKTIYIAGMGNENGQIPGCPPAPVDKTGRTIMFLKPTKKNNVFEIEFKPNIGEADQLLDDFTLSCNIFLEEDGDAYCDNFVPLTKEEGCVAWTPIPPLPTPEPEMTPEPEPTKQPEPESEEEQPEPESEEEQPEPTDEPNPKEPVVDIDGHDNGNDKQSDEGYDTKKGEDSTSAKESKDDGNGSTVLSASFLATVISIFLTIVV